MAGGPFVSIDGLEELDQLFSLLISLGENIGEPARELLEFMLGLIQDYPPAPGGSTYLRTRRLELSWFIVPPSGSELGKILSLGVAYASLVQQYGSQAGVHIGRWPTDQSVAEAADDKALELLDPFLEQLIARYN